MKTLTLCLALLATAAPVATQTPDSKAQDSKPQDKQAKKLAWPKLSPSASSKLKIGLRKVKSDDEEKAAEAEANLIAIGPAVAPRMARVLGGKDEDLHEPAARVLDAVLEKQHAPLIVPWMKKKQPAVRRYVTLRLARFHMNDAKGTLEKALKDKDADVQFHAALGLAGLGDFGSLDVVFAHCREGWRDIATTVHEVLEPARSRNAVEELSKRMRDADDQAVITGLRLMRSLCPRDYAIVLKSRLDAQQHAIKKEAINALRAVVDGEPPLENLSVFQAIELCKKWKARV